MTISFISIFHFFILKPFITIHSTFPNHNWQFFSHSFCYLTSRKASEQKKTSSNICHNNLWLKMFIFLSFKRFLFSSFVVLVCTTPEKQNDDMWRATKDGYFHWIRAHSHIFDGLPVLHRTCTITHTQTHKIPELEQT